jgi:DNA-directed RNA polymerase subunit E'/Rpb7
MASNDTEIELKTAGKGNQIYGVYIKSLLTKKIILSITEVGKNVKRNLEASISKKNEGKCIAEGFIKPNSVRVLSYSSGSVNGEYVEFQTVFECMICHPVEGMLIECDTKTITKAGIHAEVIDDRGNIPVTVFVARDHHFSDKVFNTIKENTKITIRVIGIRYELNDPYICVIGKLIEVPQQKKMQYDRQTKPAINILED